MSPHSSCPTNILVRKERTMISLLGKFFQVGKAVAIRHSEPKCETVFWVIDSYKFSLFNLDFSSRPFIHCIPSMPRGLENGCLCQLSQHLMRCVTRSCHMQQRFAINVALLRKFSQRSVLGLFKAFYSRGSCVARKTSFSLKQWNR